ncbi:MAG TPA: hypothetical protein P5228_01925 [Bacteroidales bacterium]|nr:hypothetical protein [Bacteroidales bacterium]HRZ49999.1 hypothetical protein [Bacteroidales bacterium]
MHKKVKAIDIFQLFQIRNSVAGKQGRDKDSRTPDYQKCSPVFPVH